MERPEILFIFAQYDDLKRKYIGTTYHLGTGYIRAYLQEQGMASAQLTTPASRTLQGMVDEVLAINAPVVGLTCYDKSFFLNKMISREIKRRSPETKIVWGGPTATSADQLVMDENPAVDVCVRNEGEFTTHQLLECWKQGTDIDEVQGITYRQGTEIKRTPDRPQLTCGEAGKELDNLPSPYLSGMLPVTDNATVELVSARGCPYKCTFCNNSLLGMHKVRRHSVDYIIKELKYVTAKAKNLKAFFVDDAFSIDVARAKRICRTIIDEKITGVEFLCQTRIDHADEELFELFAEVGFKEVAFGLDSASPRVLNTIKKVRNNDGAADEYKKEKDFLKKYKENLEIAKSKELSTFVSIILGLPSETREDAQETLDFVKSLNVVSYTHNILQVFTGTELAQTLDKYGVTVKKGPFALPYTVDFAYDVYDVPLLENAAHRRIMAESNMADNSHWLKALGTVEQPGNREEPIQVVLENVENPTEDLCRWMAENIALDTEVIFLNDTCSHQDYQNRMKKMADGNVPVIKYMQIRNNTGTADQKTEQKNKYRLNDVIPELRKDGNHMIYNISSYKESKESTRNPREVQVRKITDRESFEAMIEAMEDIALFEVIDLAALVKEPYFIEDKCRWSQCLCRAPKLQAPIIDQEGNVRPCMSGAIAGNTGMAYSEIRQRLQTLREETEARRGCTQCDVRYECSRCLHIPEFMDEEEYCEFRREYAPLHRAVEAGQIATQLLLQIRSRRIQAAQMNELQISGLNSRMFYHEETEPAEAAGTAVKKGFIMVRLNKDYFLFDIERVKMMRMNDKMAAIFEMLESRPYDEDYAAGWLAEKYGISRPEATEMLTTAMNLFRQLKVV